MANENEGKLVLTRDGARKLEEELEDLKTNKRQEVQEHIKLAVSFGDLSENAEYSAAKEQQARIEGRIMEIEEQLRQAQIVDNDASAGSDAASIGSTVKVFDMEYEEEDTYKIVGASEADPAKLYVSNESPIGNALIGAKVDSVVEVETPGGIVRLKILEITH